MGQSNSRSTRKSAKQLTEEVELLRRALGRLVGDVDRYLGKLAALEREETDKGGT